MRQPDRNVLSTSTLMDDPVRNLQDEDLGKIEDFMIDLDEGRIAYVVLSCGGILGIGDKLLAVPWSAFTIDTDEHVFILNISKKTLENAPGFDKDAWPDMADRRWGEQIHSYYGHKPYWIYQ